MSKMVDVPPAKYLKPPTGGSGQSASCDHVYRHLETNKHTEYEGWHHLWVKIDRFYCEKCLEIEMKKQEVYSREQPDWY